MADKSIDKTRFSCVVWVLVVAFGVLSVIMTSPVDPLPYQFPGPLPKLEGSLERNNVLQRAKRMFEGLIFGPESFAVNNNGTLYTGTADGKIFAFSPENDLTMVVRTGIHHPNCGTPEMEPECGRPKGMKVGRDGYLYVVDSYKGLLKVDIAKQTVETLLPAETGCDGMPFNFLNGLDMTPDGDIYFTDSSSKWQRRQFRYAVIETRPDGRLLHYDVTSGICRTLLDDLYLANGVCLSRDKSYLLISEMSVARIRRYYLKGKLAGSSDIFIDNLPGFPDNIKLDSRGSFYVGMGSVRFKGSSPIGSFLDLIAPYPSVKRFIVAITPLQAYNVFLPKHSLAIVVDASGKITSSLHDPGAKVITAVSEVFEHNNSLYIGHFQSPYIGKLTVPQTAGRPSG